VTINDKFKTGMIVSVLNIAIADCKDLICETKDNKLSDVLIDAMDIINKEKEKIRKVKDGK